MRQGHGDRFPAALGDFIHSRLESVLPSSQATAGEQGHSRAEDPSPGEKRGNQGHDLHRGSQSKGPTSLHSTSGDSKLRLQSLLVSHTESRGCSPRARGNRGSDSKHPRAVLAQSLPLCCPLAASVKKRLISHPPFSTNGALRASHCRPLVSGPWKRLRGWLQLPALSAESPGFKPC